jgi:DivIVA domain-containing protein
MDEVMPLTPEDVSNKRFTPVRLREGYDMGEVDQFLDEVEAELARLNKENEDLRAQLAAGGHAPVAPTPVEPKVEAPAPVSGAPAPVAPAPVAPAQIETLKVETVADASSAAARLLELATRNHDSLIETAKNDADKILGEAKQKAERTEAESKANADKVEADARQRASMLDWETSQKREQLFGDLEKERDKLSVEVENLRAFEREYRSRLKSYFTQQLESLNNGEAGADVEGSSPKRHRSALGEDA